MFTRFSAVVEQFRSANPKVDLQLREMTGDQQVEQLLDGTLDIGFIRDGEPTEGLEIRRLFSEPYVAILPEGHRLAGAGRLQVAKLEGECFVLFFSSMTRLLKVCLAAGFQPAVVQEASEWASILSLVATGMGVSIAPASVSRLSMPGTTFRPLRSERRSTIDVGSRSELKNPAAKVLVAMAEQEFGVEQKLRRPDPLPKISGELGLPGAGNS